MNKRLSLVLVLALLLIAGALAVPARAASTQPLTVAVSFETALNAGDFAGLTGLFAPDGVYVDGVGGEEIRGAAAIHKLFEGQHRDFRTYEIVGASMAGDRLTLTVEISDHGVAWGRQTLQATVEDGLLVRLEPIGFRFLF